MAKRTQQFKLSEELTKSMVTSRFRASYEHLVEPWTGDDAKEPRYSVQMIFPKGDKFIRRAKNTVKKIAQEAFGPNAVKLLQRGKLHNPFRDGDEEFPEDEIYKDSIFVNANGAGASKKAPMLYDPMLRDVRKMDNPEEVVYSGCYMEAEIKFFPFDREGGKGVACFLFRAQKKRDGEPLGGGRPVDEVFSVDEDAEDDYGMSTDDEDDF